MEAVYMLLLNGDGTLPLLRSLHDVQHGVKHGFEQSFGHGVQQSFEQGVRDAAMAHHCVDILSRSAFLATKALVDTQCMNLCPQTRANLLALMSCLLTDLQTLESFPPAKLLRSNLQGLQAQLKEISAPAQTTPHAVLYRLLSGINHRTSQLMLGDVLCFDELTRLVTCATLSLAEVELTPTIRVIVRGLMCTLRKHQHLPRPLSKALTALSQCLRQKRVKLQICS